MRLPLLIMVLLAACAFGQTRFTDPGATMDSPLKLQRLSTKVAELALLDTIDGSDEVTATDYDSAGAADNITNGLQSGTPTARRGSGSYYEVTWEGDADDYIEFNFTSPFALGAHSDYNYLSIFAQSDATTAAQVAAEGTLTFTNVPSTGDTFLLGTRTYTMRSTANLTGAANEIEIGSTAALTVTAIIAAVNSQFTAIATGRTGATTSKLIFTSKTPGLASDSEVLTESMDNCTVDGSGTLGGTVAGTDATYQMRFQDNAGTTILTADVPAIATASVWVVLEIPLWGTSGGMNIVKYIDLVNVEGNSDVLDLERMILSDYVNGGGPVPNGCVAASMIIPSTVTATIDRGDLVGWDPGTMFTEFNEGASNDNFPIGYVIGGAAGVRWFAGDTILVQVSGNILVRASGTDIVLARPVYASAANTIDGNGTNAVGVGTALETQASAGAYVEIDLSQAGGTTASVSADSIDGTELADTITLDADLVFDADTAGEQFTFLLDENLADAFQIEGTTTPHEYMVIDTDTDLITFGNATSNPAFTVAGSGLATISGSLAVTSVDAEAAEALLIGAATATSVEIADAGVTTDVQGPVTVLGGIDTAGAAALVLGAATATSVEIADAGVTTDIQGPVTILGTTGAGLDTAGATAMYIAEATATSLNLGATDIDTISLGRITALGGSGEGIDSTGAGSLYIAQATATELILGAADITTTVSGALTVLGTTGNGLDAATGTALYVGEANATSLELGASDINTNVLGPLTVLGTTSNGLDSTGATALYIGEATATSLVLGASDISTSVTGAFVMNGGQTNKHWIPAAGGTAGDYGTQLTLDSVAPPAVTADGTSGQSEMIVLAFDARAAGSDEYAYLHWKTPDGYVVDSAKLNIVWFHPAAETGSDAVAWDGTVSAFTDGEDWDVAGTGMAVVSDTTTNGTADLIQVTQLDIEVLTIAEGDLVHVQVFCDASASAMTGDVHVVGFEFEWESTE